MALRSVIFLMTTMVVKRGDIFYADLSPVIGSETECLGMTPEENTDKAETESACAEPEMIYVYICGHVRQPDVYSLAAGTRL